MPRRLSSYIPLGVVTQGLATIQPAKGINIASRGLIVQYPFGIVPTTVPDPAPLLSTVKFDNNGTQRLLSDDITALHFSYAGQELFSNPDREYTGYAANGFWYTNGVLDPTHVPFKATWASEGEGEPNENRGDLDRLPKRVITVATTREVAMFDADTLDLWMRFVIGNINPPGAGRLVGGPGTEIRDVSFANGFLIIATNFGLRVANFRTDKGFRLGQANAVASGDLGLVNRNDDALLDEQTTTASNLRLLKDDCLAMDAGAFAVSSIASNPTTKSTRTVAAIGHEGGITAVRFDVPGSPFPRTVQHVAQIDIGNGWEVEPDGDFDDTSPFFVDDNFDATNWAGLGVLAGDILRPFPLSLGDFFITKVENIQPGRRLSAEPELNLTDTGPQYSIVRAVRAVLISPELHLYFANGSGSLAVVRDQAWATTPGTVFTDLRVAGDNFSELTALVDTINDLAKRGDLLLAATSLGVFVATDEDLDERRRAEFRYSTPAVTEVDATYKILEGSSSDTNCPAITVDPETGNIQVAVTDMGSIVSEINPNIQQTFRFFDNVGRILALATYRNPVGPPDDLSGVG